TTWARKLRSAPRAGVSLASACCWAVTVGAAAELRRLATFEASRRVAISDWSRSALAPRATFPYASRLPSRWCAPARVRLRGLRGLGATVTGDEVDVLLAEQRLGPHLGGRVRVDRDRPRVADLHRHHGGVGIAGVAADRGHLADLHSGDAHVGGGGHAVGVGEDGTHLVSRAERVGLADVQRQELHGADAHDREGYHEDGGDDDPAAAP